MQPAAVSPARCADTSQATTQALPGAEAATVLAVILLPAGRALIAQALLRSALPHLVGEDKIDGLTGLLADLDAGFTTGALADYSVVECNPVIIGSAGPRIADALLIK